MIDNPSQLQEQFINFMSDHVVKLMKETDDFSAKEDIFFQYLKAINKTEYDFFDIQYIGMNRQEKHAFIENVEQNGIYIHQPPFFGNTTEEQFKKIFKQHPEWCTEYKFVGIENYVRALFKVDAGFLSAILTTILWTILNMVIQVVVAFYCPGTEYAGT